MGSLGSASIELILDRSQFDSDLKKLSAQDAGAIALRLDTKDFERQIKGLQGFIPAISIPVVLDTSKLKTQLASIKNIEIKARVVVDDSEIRKLKVAPQLELFEVGDQFSEKISDAIEKGFKKSQPKTPGLASKLFSGIGDTLLAPLKGIATGAFEGVGLQLSKQLGLGLSRGIESQLSPAIGSFDLLGEKLITGVAPKLGNTVGGKIAGAILNSKPLQNLRQELAAQITSIVGESEQLIASQAGRQQSKQRSSQQQKLAQRELAGQLQTAIASAPQKQQQVEKVRQSLPKYQQEIKTRESQLSGLQADRQLLVEAGEQTEEIEQAVKEIDLQIAEASEALVQAKKSEKALQQLIQSLLNETSVAVGRLKLAGADTSVLDDINFGLKESAVKGKGVVAQMDGNIKIQQDNLKEARSRLKQYRQNQAQFKQEAIAAAQAGDDVKARALLVESSKERIKTEQVTKEIAAYKDNIGLIVKDKQEVVKEIAEGRNKDKERLEAETKKLADSLSAQEAEVVPVRARKIKPKTRTKATTADIQPIKLDTAILKELPPSPQIFKDVVAQFSAITGASIAPEKIPQLVRGAEGAKYNGKYSPADNTISLPAERYDNLAKGVLSSELVKTLVHELRHAMQTAFGKRTLTQSASPEFELVKGTPEELQQLGGKIEGSTQFFKRGALNASPQNVATIKTLEEDAYVFAERYFEQVFKNIEQGLQAGLKSGGLPTEAELLKQVAQSQATITANLKQSFKGKASDRKVTNQDLAATTLSEIDQQIALVSEQLKRTDLSGEARQKLGQFKGTIERQYRTYSPALRAKQPGSSSLGLSRVQSATQAQGVELFEVSDEALREFERQTRAAERRAKRVLGNIFKNSNRAAKRADKALAQLEQETSQQVADIEANNAYDDAIASRRTRRTLRKIQRGYGGSIDAPTIETEVPGVEKDIKPLQQQPLLKRLGKEFRLAQLGALSKQAEYLGQQAQILLSDVDAQIALGRSAQKEAQIVERQAKVNERELNQILNTLKRAKAGKEPALTPGDLQRLNGRSQDLIGRIDADKQRLSDLQPTIQNAKELTPVAKKLRSAGEGAALAVKQQDIKGLEKYNAELRENLKLLGETPSKDPFEQILTGTGKLGKALPNVFTLLKGIFAFQVSSFIQGFFINLSTDAFKAYVELDRLKTALNFASGGSAGGAQNLAFLRKTVDDLKIPLKSSTEGFVNLAAAARGTAIEGAGTRDLFLGMADASTVLSLSNEQSQRAFKALTDILNKGKVSAEEMRGQLSESGLAGAMGIAARAMGVTEQEFSRLLDTGQIFSQDFLPKFAKQLQAEFGDAAKDAAGNAQSAIFGVENAFLSLQQGIGEGVSPAATAGLNGLSAILKGLASVAKELGFILLGVTAALSIKMVGALQAVIAQLIATKLATGTLGGGMASLAQTVNNSFSVKLTAGIFAVLEVINLLNQAVNTDLTSSFDKAAASAKRAAEESRKAFEKPGSKGQNAEGTPESSSGVGRFLDKYLIGLLNKDLGPFKGGIGNSKIKTYGELERDRVGQSVESTTGDNTDFLISARTRLNQFKSRSGDIGQLPALDSTLRDAEQQRQILQAGIKRNFTDKGLAIPAEDKRRLEAQNLRITDLNNQRSELAKPFTLDITRTDQQINALKAQIESLKSPEAIAAVGGTEAATDLTQQLQNSLEKLKKFKSEAENALASLRVDPVLAFTQSLRQLNLTLAESQEKNELRFNTRREAITRSQVSGFSTNKLATRNAALQSAIAERDKNQNNVLALEEAVRQTDATVNAPGLESTLQRLGLTPDASIAKIDDILKNTSDEADKGILEKLKSARDQRNKLSEAKLGLSESQLKVKQQVQDNSLFSLDESAASSRAASQKAENQKIARIKNAQATKSITDEVANEKLSRIQLSSTVSQQKNLTNQLSVLRTYYKQGTISAEEFAKRERDLTTEQTNLERTEAENRLAVAAAVKDRKLKEIELVNKKAETAIALNQTNATAKAKQDLLAGGLTATAQDEFALAQNSVEQKATTDKIALIKDQLAQTKKLRLAGVLDAREATDKELSLNQELAQNNLQLVDLKIAEEEKYREIVERNIQKIVQAEDNRYKSFVSQLDAQKSALELYNQSLDRTAKLEESRYNLGKALSDAAIAPLESRRDNANRALDLSRKLKDENLDPSVRGEINSQLNALGFGTNELDILAKRSQIEDEIAAKKLEALKLEQEYQKKSLQLDLQRQKIAAETAVYDAQSAQLSAAKAKLEAEAALRIATIKKDDVGIQSAKVGLEIAQREIGLSDKRLDNALQNLSAQDELSQNAVMAQEATQRTAIDQQLAADSARKQANALERAESSVKKMEQPLKESADKGLSSGDKANVDGWENPYIQKKGEGLFAYNLRINKMRAEGQIVETRNTVNTLDTKGYKYDLALNRQQGNLPPVDNTAQMTQNAQIKPPEQSNGYSQFVDALKTANQGIEKRLDTLSDRIMQLANTPRSLTVQTPNAVDDAADIMNRIGRGQVAATGL
ncbi:tape measure protein [Dendronalium sp. ChiSLP03b]|uniref:tape measure protein n=1 Tax=Dendronalium sp. ChiSLP03b TaxID=3075381 RepID=UPI00391C0268